MAAIARWPPIARIEGWLASLPPWAALIAFAAPSTLVLPVKLAAVWFAMQGKFVLATGEWDICRKANEDFSALLGAKGIPHSLHVWGFGSKHDWPYWQPMANAYLP